MNGSIATTTSVRRRRHSFQFGLGRLLFVVALIVVLMGGWIVREQHIAHQEDIAVRELRLLGAEVYRRPRRLASYVLGDRALSTVGVGLRNRVGLEDASKLAPLANLHQLVWIDLQGTHLGNDGLAHLAGLSNLRRLRIDDTLVTDSGLKHLEKSTSLQVLNLSNTEIGDTGLAEISNLRRLRELRLVRTNITDAGLKHLQRLSQLEVLTIRHTAATPTARRELKKQLVRLP